MERNTVLLDLKDYEDLKTNLRKAKKELSSVLHDKTIHISEYISDERGHGSRHNYFYSKIESVEHLAKQRNDKIEQICKLEKEIRELTDNKIELKQELRTIKDKWWYKLFK